MGRWSSTEDGVIQRLVAARTAGCGTFLLFLCATHWAGVPQSALAARRRLRAATAESAAPPAAKGCDCIGREDELAKGKSCALWSAGRS